MYVPRTLHAKAQREAERTTVRNPLGLMFEPQRAMANDLVVPGARVAMQCSRRGGKSEGFILTAVAVMQAKPCCKVGYAALSRPSAKRIIWDTLKAINDRLGLGFSFHETDLIATAPNGSKFYVLGCNTDAEVAKIRGNKYALFGLDEAAYFTPSRIRYLVQDVIIPCLMDHRGGFAMFSTAGAVCAGLFYDVTTGKVGARRWQVHKWGIHDNPHIPDVDEQLRQIREDWDWDEDNPTYRREYLNEWVVDEDAMVFSKFRRERNLIQRMPDGYAPGADGWSHIVSIDYGYKDSTAWTIWAFRTDGSGDKHAYVVRSFKWGQVPAEFLVGIDTAPGCIPSVSAEVTKRIYDKYTPWRVLGDVGGLGKGYSEETRHRFGIAVRPADKLNKLGQIELVNDGLGSGRILVVEDDNQELIEELTTLQWVLKPHEVTVGGLVKHELRREVVGEDHAADAFRYGYPDVRAHFNQLAEEPKEEVYKRDPGQWVRDQLQQRAAGDDSEWWDRD